MENIENVQEKKFDNSQVILNNRKELKISGVERVYESNESKLQLKVAGSNVIICGEQLSITKLDVKQGLVEASGLVTDIKYTGQTGEKSNFFKRIFK